MPVPKRLALAACAALLGGAAAFVPPVAALAQFPSAGSQSSTFQTASFSTDPSNFDQSMNVQVTVQGNASMPPGGPRTSTTTVQVSYGFTFLNSDGSFVFGNGCIFLADPSQFTLDSKLQTAFLNTTIANDQTCGFANGPIPQSISVTWSAASPVLSQSGNQHFACSGYTLQTMSSNSSDSASATATITFAPPQTGPGTFPSFQASLLSQTIQTFAQGTVPADTCAQGIGRGSFGGFPAAGNYHNTVTEAIADVFPTDPSIQVIEVDVKRISSTSAPLAGPATSTNETDVNVYIQSNTLSGFGCFRVDPANFTVSSDLTSAQLNAQLDSGTPTCQSGTISPPFDLNVSWAGPGPISSITGNSSIACAQYHSVSSSSQTINGSPTATITLTIPGAPATILGPFTTTGAVGSTDSRTQAAGVLASNCQLGP